MGTELSSTPKLENEVTTIIDNLVLPNKLENDADINKLSHTLLSLVDKCLPLAEEAYQAFPKESNARALNSFISQSRELANDIRSLQDKKKNVSKIMAEVLKPVFTQIYEEMLNIPDHLKEVTTGEYEDNIKNFLTSLLKMTHSKIEEIF